MCIIVSCSLAGTDVRVYDWNPTTNDTGSLSIQVSVTTVTDREDFNFPSKYMYVEMHVCIHDVHIPYSAKF